MKMLYALLLALLITIAVANIYYLHSLSSQISSKHSMVITRVIDGDTIVFTNGEHARLLNINAPEKNLASSVLATDYLKAYENKTIIVDSTGKDMYQRTLTRIYDENGDYINLNLVKLGLASKFLVQQSELSIFAESETDAVDKGIGIWNHSVYYGCLTSEIDKYAEIVIIFNKCAQINFNKFTLKDESRKTFNFPGITFQKIIIHSRKGTSNSTDLFWNQDTDVWNNDRDTVYIFDSEGKIVHTNPYGY